MEGFVPHSYCAPYTSQLAEQTLASLMNNVKKKLPRSNDGDGDANTARSQALDSQHTDTGSASDCESYARNVTTADININRNNISQSQNSIQNIPSQPDVHPFFKVKNIKSFFLPSIFLIYFFFLNLGSICWQVHRTLYICSKR